MPQGYSWEKLLHSSENKNDLIKLIVEYLKSPESKRCIFLPITVNEEGNTWSINYEKNSNHKLVLTCNHEEADTRMVLHAATAADNEVVVSKDPNVLILMFYAYSNVIPAK